MKADLKVPDLVVQKIKLRTRTSQTLVPFKILSFGLHTILPTFLPLLEELLEDLTGICSTVGLSLSTRPLMTQRASLPLLLGFFF